MKTLFCSLSVLLVVFASAGVAQDSDSDTRCYELRIYHAAEGKLDDLHKSFRDYTLIYLLAHRDEASRTAGFGAFRQDPKWQSARKASEANGKLLVNKGVESEWLLPTDYSPAK